MTALTILLVLLVLAAAAPRYGVDTRTSDSWTVVAGSRPGPRDRPTPLGDLRTAGRAITRRLRQHRPARRRPLVAFAEVRRLHVTAQSHIGVRPIEVARIVGSLDRSTDFDRDFRPRHHSSDDRLQSLRTAFPDGNVPPIEAFEVGGAYFVSDGHHRVALARQESADRIDADVTRIETNVEIGPDVDVRQFVHTQQQQMLMRDSGLAVARPGAVIEFSRPGGYPELLELIKAHGYDLARRHGSLPDRTDVAADWHDTVYAPGVAALRREALPEAFAYKTDADLFLWVYQRRRALRVTVPGTDFAAAARDARGRRVGHRFRNAFLLEKSTPLHTAPPTPAAHLPHARR